MANASIEQIIGTTRRHQITATAGGKPITGRYTADDALSAKIWPGGDLAAVVFPRVEWVDATQGTTLLTIRAADLAAGGVTAGTYKLEVDVTPAVDGEPRCVFYGDIQFRPTAGTGTAQTSIASWADMLTYSRDVSKLQDEDTDQTRFSGQRTRAWNLFREEVARRYTPRLGGSRRYMNADGTGPGPFLRFAPPPGGQSPPSRAQVEAWLVPGRLTINEDIIEANARLAASLVYGSSPGQNNPYQQMADKERAMATAAIQRAVIEIDTSEPADGVADIRIDRDVIYLT